MVFETIQILLWQFGGGSVSAIRGFATAAGRMGIFILSYQLGQGKLKSGMKTLFLSLVMLLIVQETASMLLANVLPTLGVAFAAYILGSGKIPWKVLALAVLSISVLHAGKYEMRDIYFEKPRPGLMELPGFFEEWVQMGLKNLGMGKPLEEKKETTSAAQRASLIQVMIRVQTMSPDPAPFLEGISYQFIPPLLIPRILSPEKMGAHTGNSILSLHYGFLQAENVNATSVAFDLIIEAYANFGFLGVLLLALLVGFFIGIITRLTIHVPMLSFGFLFGVQSIEVLISSFNTAGVFVTSMWQAFLALVVLSFFLMHKANNPVWKYYALKLVEKLKFKSDAKTKKALEEALQNEESAEELRIGDSGSGDSSKGEREKRKEKTAAVMHERPIRFVYGENKAKQKS